MGLDKLVLILRARWWSLLFLGVIGAVAGLVFSTIRNDRIEPEFRAEAPLTLHRAESDTSGRELNLRVDEARAQAIDANEEMLLASAAEISTEVTETKAELLFIAYGSTGAEAGSLALEMRDRYLEVEPIGVDAVEADLADYSRQVEEIQQEIANLEAQRQDTTVNEQALNLLNGEIAQLQSRAIQLAVDLALYEFADTERTEAEIEQELEATTTRILELEGRLDNFDSPDPNGTERELRIQALRQQEANLTAAYLELFLNQVGASELTTLGVVDSVNVSSEPISRSTSAVGGFFLAVVAGLALVLLFDMTRKPVWAASDIRGTRVVGTLTPRKVTGAKRDYWYERSAGGRRLGDIAAIRADIDPVIGADAVAIGVSRVGTPARDLKAAVADLGMSLAAVGKSVMLLDADFDTPSDPAEFHGNGPSLAELLSVWTELAVTRVMIKEALEGSQTSALNLRGLESGTLDRRPAADVLAGPGFSVVLSEARELADVVLVAASEATDPATLTLAQRVDYTIVVARARTTTESQLEDAKAALESKRARFLGVVLQERQRERSRVWPSFGRRGAHIKKS